MRKLMMALKRDERGVSALEYAILAGIIVVVVAGALLTFGGSIDELFGRAQSGLNEALEKSKEVENIPDLE